MTLPTSANRDRLELAFHLALVTPLMSVHCYAAPEAAAAYERARALLERLDDAEGLLMVLFGLGAQRRVRGEPRASLKLAEQCLLVAERYAERDYRLLGHYNRGLAYMQLGELPKARSECEKVVVLYDPKRDSSLAARCIVDPRATGLGHLSLVRYAMGYPEQARRVADEALQCASQLGHANTSGHVRFFAGAQLAQLLRDTSAVRDHANAVIALVEQHDVRVGIRTGSSFSAGR